MVRIAATAICHSDVHIVLGEWSQELPVVAGHEAAGVIEGLGEHVTQLSRGDTVAVSLLRSCGNCFYCLTGSPNLCEATWPSDQASPLSNSQGKRLNQGMHVGSFAEFVVVDQSQVVVIPKDLPMDCAALLGCGVITGVGAVVNTVHVSPGNSVIVIGTGGVGINAVQGARLAGANPIVAVDVLKTKLEAARAFGATHTVDATETDVVEAIRSLTGGRGADYAVVTVGTETAVGQAAALIRAGGTAVIAALPTMGTSARIDIGRFKGERKLVGSSMGSTRLRVDVPRLVALYRRGQLMLDELITGRYELDKINEAIAATEHGQSLRNVIVF